MSRKDKYIKQYGNTITDKILRVMISFDCHEDYVRRKDPLGRAILFGNEDELAKYNIAGHIIGNKEENYDYLYMALDELKEHSQLEYEVVTRFYLDDKYKNAKEIAAKLGLSFQYVYNVRDLALRHLLPLILKYQNQV